MAPVKPAVPTPNANYAGQPHEQMKALVTQNYDPATATAVSDAWKAIGTTFKELATDFSILVNGSQDGWKGRAAEGVRAALSKVGTFSDQTGEAFVRTSSAIEQQRDAAVQANKSMPQPVEFNPMKIAGDWLTNKGGIVSPIMMVGAPVEMISTYNKQQGAKEEAVQVMQTRDNTMMAAAMSMPTMESTPKVTNDQGTTQPSSTTHSQSLSNVNTNQRFSNNTGMPGMPNTGNGTTNPAWVAPPVKEPNPGNPNNPPNGGNPNRPPYGPPGMLPPGTRPPGGGGQGRPPGGGQGMRPGGPGGPGGGAGGRGAGGGGMAGVNGSGRGMGSFGPANPGGGAGVMGGAAGGAGAGAAGRVGAAGGMGAGGAGAGAGAGQGQEDKEHKSNYLVPTDEFFDDDRMVAPPVIGG
ncbi:hypothetical protein C8D87_111125 [Lentzea atacamensis]|uniref:WXG100 family type VII secretion target n=1 Tax=Lentzea atacamensis TaxID=531938 RepID=A0ABX9DYY1_9PSEU|nr:hypothetical protein [Lentzea atacamensis]RAS60706.1 hypothetical protein C8D87_111125 [Lentzea atacamensis]